MNVIHLSLTQQEEVRLKINAYIKNKLKDLFATQDTETASKNIVITSFDFNKPLLTLLIVGLKQDDEIDIRKEFDRIIIEVGSDQNCP